MIGRRVRPAGESREGVVAEWEPYGAAMCDSKVEFDDGSVCWYGSSSLRPVDGMGPLPSREEACLVADELALVQLRAIRADLVREVKEHKPWPFCEFGKALVGRGIDGAIADVERRLRRS